MPDIVTLDEVKEALNDDTTAHDEEIQDFIDAAAQEVEDRVGIVVSTEVTEVFDGLTSRRKLLLSNYPVSEVASVVTSSQGTTVSEYVTADLQVDSVTGQVWLLNGGYLSGDVTVVYTAGRVEVPANLKRAVLEDVKGLYQRSQLGSAASVPGFPEVEESLTSMPVSMFPRIRAYASENTAPSVA